MAPPCVTVAVPTYNRAAELRRAVASVQAQTEVDLEIIVSDNHSDDDTQELAHQFVAADSRIRYVRHERNLGLTANFNSVLTAARGRYVLVLADDDWIDPTYVARCRATLDADKRLAVASGTALYRRDDGGTATGVHVDLLDPNPARRVCRFYGLVADNVTLYGLIRRSLLERALPMRNCLAGDWLLVARLAFLGTVVTDRGVYVHRSADGTSADIQQMVRRMGLTDFEARHPHLAMMRFARIDIARDSPAYAPLVRSARAALGLAAAAQIARTHPAELAIEEVLSRPRMASVHRALRRMAGHERRNHVGRSPPR